MLPTRLPDKVRKPKWAKFRKTHSKVSARSLTGAEAAEMVADRAEKNSKAPSRQVGQIPQRTVMRTPLYLIRFR